MRVYSISLQSSEEVSVVRFVLQVEDTEKFPQTLGFDNLDPFLN